MLHRRFILAVVLIFQSGITLALGPSSSSSLQQQRRRFAATRSVVLCSTSAETQPKLATEQGKVLGEKLMSCNLYLIGAMGSGKSAVGDVVSRMLGSYTFVDTDATVESVTNMSIPEIFASEGEDKFRDYEQKVLEQIAAFGRLVVATGGGIVTRSPNWASLRNGIVVWLNPAVDILVNRLNGDDISQRPLLADGDDLETTVTRILDDRRSLYSEADVVIDIADPDESPSAIADRLVDDVIQFIIDHPPKKPPAFLTESTPDPPAAA